MDEVIEAMARAIAERTHDYSYERTGKLPSQSIISATAAYNALRETLVPVGWECFRDEAYYDMWCVRPVGSRAFGEGFHLVNGDEAKWLCRLLGTLYALPEIDNG